MLQTLPSAQKADLNTTRSKIVELESVMKQMKEHQIHIEPKHYFAPGLYLREITIPADCTLTGKIHLTEHLCILSKGKVQVMTENGIVTLEAGAVVHSLPGMKRVLYAVEESIWVNVHHNPENIADLEEIENFYVVETYAQLLEHNSKQVLVEGNK